MTATITVMMGAPGSGKSTWCRANAGDATVLTADAIRAGADPAAVFESVRRRALRELRRGRDVVVDACSTIDRDRAEWLAIADSFEAHTRLVVISTPPAVCARRDRRRRRPAGRPDVYAARMRESLRAVAAEPWDEVITVEHEAQRS